MFDLQPPRHTSTLPIAAGTRASVRFATLRAREEKGGSRTVLAIRRSTRDRSGTGTVLGHDRPRRIGRAGALSLLPGFQRG